MKAVILAGGFGTRLRPLTFIRPKHMLPIVDKPMLEHIIENIVRFDIFDEIIISIGRKEEFQMIVDHFSKKDFEIRISFVKEERRLGGVGAIKNVVEKCKLNEDFLLILGDNLTEIDLKKMVEFHQANPADVTVALKKDPEPWRYCVVKMEGVRIKDFVEKPPIGQEPSKLIATGVYIIKPSINPILSYDFLDSTGMLFPILLENGKTLNGYEMQSFWVDVGRPSSYLEATAYILKKYGKENWIDDNVEIGEGTKIEGPVVIYGDTKIGENCLIRNSVIFKNNQIGNECKIVNSILDKSCKIGNNINISTTLGRGSILKNGENFY